MKLDRTLPLAAAALIALTLAVGGWVVQMDESALLTEAEAQQIEATALVLSTAMDQAASLSATHSESLAQDPVLRSLMRSGDRDGLLRQTRPALARLGNLAGVDVMHFHTADMESFLRVWEPQNFGQDLSAFRPMIVAVNHDHRTRKGLELGVKGLSLRAVSAILDKETLVGTVEVGVDLKSLTELAKAATGADYALFLDTSALINDKGGRSTETGLKMEAATDSALFDLLVAKGAVRLSRAPYLLRTEADGHLLGVMGRPLLDFSGKMIGTIIVTRDFSALESHLSRSLVTIGAVSICGFLVVFSLIMVALRAFLLRPLTALTDYLQAEAGDADPPPAMSGLAEFRALYAALAAWRRRVQAGARETGH